MKMRKNSVLFREQIKATHHLFCLYSIDPLAISHSALGPTPAFAFAFEGDDLAEEECH